MRMMTDFESCHLKAYDFLKYRVPVEELQLDTPWMAIQQAQAIS